MASRLRFGCCASLVAALFAHDAPAATVPSLDFRRFTPSSDAAASLRLEPPATPGHLAWNAGLWASYAHRLVVLEDGEGNEVAVPVEHQFSLDYVAELGLTDRLALGVVLPTVLYQTGDDTTEPFFRFHSLCVSVTSPRPPRRTATALPG